MFKKHSEERTKWLSLKEPGFVKIWKKGKVMCCDVQTLNLGWNIWCIMILKSGKNGRKREWQRQKGNLAYYHVRLWLELYYELQNKQCRSFAPALYCFILLSISSLQYSWQIILRECELWWKKIPKPSRSP